MGAALNFQVPFEATCCGVCDIRFAVTGDFIRARREDGKTLYCPQGHAISFSDTEIDRLRKANARLEKEKQTALELKLRAEDERRSAVVARDRAMKREARIRKRAENGVCLYCNRSFGNLARHMHTKHPDKVHDDGKVPQIGTDGAGGGAG